MRYLCSRHQTSIGQNPRQASELWRGAMDNGVVARHDGNLQLARSFFGSAFEIALIHVHQRGVGNGLFERRHLLSAGERLGEVLLALRQSEEAADCIRLVREYLFIAAGDELLGDQERAEAMQGYERLSRFLFLQRHCGVSSNESNDSLLH